MGRVTEAAHKMEARLAAEKNLSLQMDLFWPTLFNQIVLLPRACQMATENKPEEWEADVKQ